MDNLINLFREGEEQLTFYLNKPNRKGWGVVYVRLRVGSALLRMSTGLKVKACYWNKEEGRIILPIHLSEMDIKLHKAVENTLITLKELFFSNLFDNFALLGGLTTQELINALKRAILTNIIPTKMKNKQNIALTLLLLREVEKIDRETTRATVRGMVSNFKRFLESAKIPDSLESVNQDTMGRYLMWLTDRENKISISRAKNCLNYIFKLLRNISRRYGYKFELDSTIVKDLKETRSTEERRNNSYALTQEEINKLKSLKLEGRLEDVRNIFLLQCYCGFRFGDLPLVLDSKNLREIEGIKYAVFMTTKKGITSQTPLNHPAYFPEALEIYERYVDRPPFNSKQTALYNRALKRIAKLANLDKELTITSTGGGKKKDTVKLYDDISSHTGRHTFITNCVRYKNIDSNTLKNITGHADIRQIESTYTNLQEEDKINMVHNVEGQITATETKERSGNKTDLAGVREAKSVLTYLDVT
ncbi:MAG: hypothetical protein K2M39_04670, partial [Muribaculaceae bacterium]|nr:hypothetical protein [Muribaculaceae bacterium]